MARSARVLSGKAKDVFLARAIDAEADIDDESRARLTKRLQRAIGLVALRAGVLRAKAGETTGDRSADQPEPTTDAANTVGGEPAAVFDPYSPNVIVVIRTRGREAVLDALAAIDDVVCLRLLAKEQQLWIGSDLGDASASDLRLAIVDAAERRISNRRAAAS